MAAQTLDEPRVVSEQRRAPRVAAGRPCRIRLESASITLRSALIDVSASGCRILVDRRHLPDGWEWPTPLQCTLDLLLGGDVELAAPAELVWQQRDRQGFDILGFRFADEESAWRDTVLRFIDQRLRAGLELREQKGKSVRLLPEEMAPLDVPLEAEAFGSGDERGEGYRLRVTQVGRHHLEAIYNWHRNETPRIPPAGAYLSLLVFPPAWARGERRTLRFVAQVKEATAEKVRLVFSAEGSDLAQMMRGLIPPRVQRVQKPTEIDVRVILMILLALVIALIIASRGGGGDHPLSDPAATSTSR